MYFNNSLAVKIGKSHEDVTATVKLYINHIEVNASSSSLKVLIPYTGISALKKYKGDVLINDEVRILSYNKPEFIDEIFDILFSVVMLKKKPDSTPKTKADPITADCKVNFLEFYNNEKKFPYQWSVKDGVALKKIIEMLRVIEPTMTDENLTQLFSKILEWTIDLSKTEKLFSWIQQYFTLTKIYSNINTILPELIKRNYNNEKAKSDVEARIKQFIRTK